MSNYNCLTMMILRKCRANYEELTSLINTDCLVPYKHYASEVISGVLDGIISPDDKDTVWWDSPRNFWDPGCRCSISCEVHSRNGWKHCSGFFIIPEVFLSPFNIPVLHRLCFAVTTALWYPPCKGGYD